MRWTTSEIDESTPSTGTLPSRFLKLLTDRDHRETLSRPADEAWQCRRVPRPNDGAEMAVPD
jgi:hypothetical protein